MTYLLIMCVNVSLPVVVNTMMLKPVIIEISCPLYRHAHEARKALFSGS